MIIINSFRKMKKIKKDKVKILFLLILILGVILGVIYNQYTKTLTNQASERKLRCRNATCRISKCKAGEIDVGECGPYVMPDGSTDYGICCKSK